MGEEIKEKIYKFLKNNTGKRFVLIDLHRKLKISYPSILKWTSVLVAEKYRDPPVQILDYGNVKLVWIEDGKK